MKKMLIFLTVTIVLCLSSCSVSSDKEISKQQGEEPQQSNAVIDADIPYMSEESVASEEQHIMISYGEELSVEGVLTKNTEEFPSYILILDSKLSVSLIDGDVAEDFVCNALYFYNDSEINGNYNFTLLEGNRCLVKASLENYRGGGNLFLLNPTIFVDGQEAEHNLSEQHPVIDSRANGNWSHSISRTDSQNLYIRSDGSFTMAYISVGEVKETITGTYEIISDDGQYQEFVFYCHGSEESWTAKIFQTELQDQYGVRYDGLEYITADGETILYTGQKFVD